jgi:hypothetical protein
LPCVKININYLEDEEDLQNEKRDNIDSVYDSIIM